MKRFAILILLLLCGISADAQSNIITASVTVTNMPTNGYTFSVNGNVRTWTNNVTSANNQIPTYQTVGTNIVGLSNYLQFATNFWISYISYPETGMRSVQLISSNVIQFQTLPGQPLAIATNGEPINWVTWTFTTNHITNETVLRYPTNGLGIIEQSNAAQGLIGYLNSPYATNAVNSLLPQWSNFVSAFSLAALSNYVGLVATNATNFTKLCGTAETNYANAMGLLITNYSSNLVYGLTNVSTGTVFNALTYFTNQFGLLQNNVNYHDLGNITGNTNTILLTNEGTIKRMVANANSGTIGGLFTFYQSDGSTVWLANESSSTYIKDSAGIKRLEFDDTSINSGPGIFRGPNGNPDLFIAPSSDAVQLWTPMAFNEMGTSTNIFPAVAIGTYTNLVDAQTNIGSSETDVNTQTVPGTTMTNVGDRLVRTIGIETTTGIAGYDVKVYFNGQSIFDTGSFTALSSGRLSVTCEVTIGKSGTALYNCFAQGSALSTNDFSQIGSLNLNTSINTNTYVGLTASANGELHIITDNIEFKPSSAWAHLP